MYLHNSLSGRDLDHQLDRYVVPTLDEVRRAKGKAGAHPNCGRDWVPLHHADLVDHLREAMSTIGAWSEAVEVDGHAIMGTYTFEPEVGIGGTRAQFGFRAGNLMDWAFRAVAGRLVCACWNGMLDSDWTLANKKHGRDLAIGIGEVIREAVVQWRDRSQSLWAREQSLRQTPVLAREVAHLLVEAMLAGIIPARLISPTVATYRAYQEHPEILARHLAELGQARQDKEPASVDPRPSVWISPARAEAQHEAFRGRTAWSLLNAATEVAKGCRPARATTILQRLPAFLDERSGGQSIQDQDIRHARAQRDMVRRSGQ